MFLLSSSLYPQGIAIEILSTWWSVGRTVVSKTGSDAGDGDTSTVARTVKWKELLTNNCTTIAPVDIDPGPTYTAGSNASTDRSSFLGLGNSSALVECQSARTRESDGVDRAAGSDAVASRGIKNEVQMEEDGMGGDEGVDGGGDNFRYPRTAEQKLQGWESVAAEAERIRVAREALGHPTTAGNLRLKVEVHVSIGLHEVACIVQAGEPPYFLRGVGTEAHAALHPSSH